MQLSTILSRSILSRDSHFFVFFFFLQYVYTFLLSNSTWQWYRYVNLSRKFIRKSTVADLSYVFEMRDQPQITTRQNNYNQTTSNATQCDIISLIDIIERSSSLCIYYSAYRSRGQKLTPEIIILVYPKVVATDVVHIHMHTWLYSLDDISRILEIIVHNFLDIFCVQYNSSA